MLVATIFAIELIVKNENQIELEVELHILTKIGIVRSYFNDCNTAI